MAEETTPEVVSESDAVFAWRLQQLRDLGVPLEDAQVLADRADIDLHIVRRLIRSGCKATLAVQIVS